ncbi:MAG: transporter substrate-binding domain-containing protein, partial [Clostridia bacterium]|nr:transporter substrate-binding domain-containing protein [Clostridia bacterium]
MLAALLTGCGANTTSAIPDKGESKAQDTPAEDASSATSADSDYEYIKNKGTMIIGITMYPPMNFMDKDNKLTGFDTEFAEAVCKKLGIKAEFVEINWDSKEVELNSKNIDCIWNGMCITEDRKV